MGQVLVLISVDVALKHRNGRRQGSGRAQWSMSMEDLRKQKCLQRSIVLRVVYRRPVFCVFFLY